MNIAIFTRNNDHRLRYFLQCLGKINLPVSLIVSAPQRIHSSGLKTKIKNLFFSSALSQVDVTQGLDHSVEIVDNHSSSQTKMLLQQANIDLVLLSKAGIIRKNLINGPWRILNCHPGILPRYRGVGSCEWAIYENGPLGVTVHYIDSGIDTGEILHREHAEPHAGESLETYRKRLDDLGAELLVMVAKKLYDGVDVTPEGQDKMGGVLYTRRPNAEEMFHVRQQFLKRQPQEASS